MTTNIAPRPDFEPHAGAARRLRRSQTPGTPSFELVPPQSAKRDELEMSIKTRFERTYGAQLRHFLPHLLRLDVARELGAVVGIRAASSAELFLEQYLEQPIEQAIAQTFQTPVDRAQVVEIGNLAANVPGQAYALFAVLATVLNRAGYRWVACTATPQVEAMLRRMSFSSRTLCSADASCLQEGPSDWGDYYASKPRVIVGDVRLAAAQVARQPELAALVRKLRQPILRMAANLKRAG